MAKIVKGGQRLRSQMFAELQSHYLFDNRFGRLGKGNDKGKVEGLVGYVRRNFMTPLPFSLNQIGTLLPRHLAQFVSAIES